MILYFLPSCYFCYLTNIADVFHFSNTYSSPHFSTSFQQVATQLQEDWFSGFLYFWSHVHVMDFYVNCICFNWRCYINCVFEHLYRRLQMKWNVTWYVQLIGFISNLFIDFFSSILVILFSWVLAAINTWIPVGLDKMAYLKITYRVFKLCPLHIQLLYTDIKYQQIVGGNSFLYAAENAGSVCIRRYRGIYSLISANNSLISMNTGRKLNSGMLLRSPCLCMFVDIDEFIHRYQQKIRWYRRTIHWYQRIRTGKPVPVCCWETHIHIHLSPVHLNSLILTKEPWYSVIFIFINGFHCNSMIQPSTKKFIHYKNTTDYSTNNQKIKWIHHKQSPF